ncbi:hypothetical protein PAHAL_5G365700 [Panicum hallii]|jgi:hypothetical protein|uniref:Uncharacterized protein n=1 Tax=Panicum hallii TaxID=206008 RepID=A0A2T8IMC8_9POAL|nr:hypothetical protein PAHAL_5G365700 [Panicum hallii]
MASGSPMVARLLALAQSSRWTPGSGPAPRTHATPRVAAVPPHAAPKRPRRATSRPTRTQPCWPRRWLLLRAARSSAWLARPCSIAAVPPAPIAPRAARLPLLRPRVPRAAPPLRASCPPCPACTPCSSCMLRRGEEGGAPSGGSEGRDLRWEGHRRVVAREETYAAAEDRGCGGGVRERDGEKGD